MESIHVQQRNEPDKVITEDNHARRTSNGNSV